MAPNIFKECTDSVVISQLNSEILASILINLAKDVESAMYKIENVFIGIGACSQLGLTLYDKNGYGFSPPPQNYNNISSTRFVNPQLPFQINCIAHVDTELIVGSGAIEVYGKQKGVSEIDLKVVKDAFLKINNYSTLEANEKADNKTVNLFTLLISPPIYFLHHFIIRKGFLDGIYGVIISYMHMVTKLQVQLKILEIRRRDYSK